MVTSRTTSAGCPERSIADCDGVEVDVHDESGLAARDRYEFQPVMPWKALRPLDEPVQLPAPSLEEMIVDRLDDYVGPHLVDGGISQNDQQENRDDAEQDDERRAEDGIETRVDGGGLQQCVDADADEETEVELVGAAAQELVKDLGCKRARRLLDGHEQQRERDQRHGDDGRGE